MVDYTKYVRKETTQYCPGCGNTIAIKAAFLAFEEIGWDMKDISIVSGIGCSGRASSYAKCYTVHTPHGRALPVMEGLACACPDKHIVGFSGDGDCCMGRDHFSCQCNENVDMTYIVINNFNYALTKGQASPTTPMGTRAPMTPYGVFMRPLDLCDFAIGSGATFVARGTTLDVNALSRLIKAGFLHHGFSFIEVLSVCTEFGRKNGMPTSHDMRNWIDSLTLPITKYNKLLPEQRIGKIPTGELKKELGVPEGIDAYEAMAEHARAVAKGE